MAPALRALLQARHLHEYSEFAAEYQRHASELKPDSPPPVPSRPAYYKWISGQLEGLPRGYNCAVLEAMFPGWTVQKLFADHVPESDTADGLPASTLEGLWATCYRFDDTMHHADLSVITVTGRQVVARNYPPEPRTEGHAPGFRNTVEAELHGRHLIGRWRNTNDAYYFGSIHLAVMPGENVLDGCYTGFPNDTKIVADRWKWVRVDPVSADDADLRGLRMKDPRVVYDLLRAHSHFAALPSLHDITEES